MDNQDIPRLVDRIRKVESEDEPVVYASEPSLRAESAASPSSPSITDKAISATTSQKDVKYFGDDTSVHRIACIDQDYPASCEARHARRFELDMNASFDFSLPPTIVFADQDRSACAGTELQRSEGKSVPPSAASIFRYPLNREKAWRDQKEDEGLGVESYRARIRDANRNMRGDEDGELKRCGSSGNTV